MTDRELLRLVAQGDATAFREWYDRHSGPLFAYLFRLLRDAHLAEDVLSETMLTVWREARRYRGDSSPRTWLYAIARNKATDCLRRHAPWPLEVVGGQRVDGEAERVDTRVAVEEAVKRLPPEQREVVELAFFHGFAYGEIARIVRCPLNTVKTRMFLAKQKLRAHLGEAWGRARGEGG
ncbi:MAG: RNA polymerase sigma factor [Armatimonadota bacterium]|nr:RNA polymerase sigma factor [Armatimonadota bacterium]